METLDAPIMSFRLRCPIHHVSTMVQMSPELVEDEHVDVVGYLTKAAALGLMKWCDETCQHVIEEV